MVAGVNPDRLPKLPKLPRVPKLGMQNVVIWRLHSNFGNLGNFWNFGPPSPGRACPTRPTPPLTGATPPDQRRRGLAVAPADSTGAKADNAQNLAVIHFAT